MFGCRTGIGAGCCALALGLFVGCGGAVTHSADGGDEPAAGAGGSAQAGRGGSTVAGGSASVAGSAGRGGMGGRPPDEPDPVQTACPVEELPPPSIECDPYRSDDCGPGFGCYPFVEHPEGKGCDAQTYGTICLAAGVGSQGDLCGDTIGDWCAPGFVCVVGQRAGKRCAALCEPGVANQCAGGLICGDLDVSGFGVCG